MTRCLTVAKFRWKKRSCVRVKIRIHTEPDRSVACKTSILCSCACQLIIKENDNGDDDLTLQQFIGFRRQLLVLTAKFVELSLSSDGKNPIKIPVSALHCDPDCHHNLIVCLVPDTHPLPGAALAMRYRGWTSNLN